MKNGKSPFIGRIKPATSRGFLNGKEIKKLPLPVECIILETLKNKGGIWVKDIPTLIKNNSKKWK